MAKFVVGAGSFDMTAWDLSDIADGSVTSDGATAVDVTGADGYFDYTLTGTGLGSFDVNGFPQSGTITGLTMVHPGKTPMTITGISIAASDFMTFVNGNDPAGLEAAVFSGNDSFFGRAGNDVLLGFGGNDTFNLTKGGNDTASGGDGNDSFVMGAAFTAADTIDGGAGADKIHLDGDYSAGLLFSSTTMSNVEFMTVAEGFNYNLTLNAATVTVGQSLTVTASGLAAANHITLDASAVAGDLRLVGGAGNDTLIAGTGDNTVSGGAGDDVITFSNWTTGDIVNGGTGGNTLAFNGDFSGGVTLTGTQIKNVVEIDLTAGHSYNITLASITGLEDIGGDTLGVGDSMTVDASAFSGVLGFNGGAGTNVIQGNNSGDYYYFLYAAGGHDTIIAGTGADRFFFGTNFTAADSINGGGGGDVLELNESNVSYSANLVLGATTMTNIHELEVSANTNVNITTNDATVAAGQTMVVELDNTHATQTTTFDGAAETDGSFNISINNDTANIITGGAGNDTFDVAYSGFNAGNRFDGGGGYNILNLGDSVRHAAAVRITDHAMSNIQELDVGSYENVISRDGDVAAGQTLAVHLNGGAFNGSLETDGTFQISGSAGTAYGGAGDDTITISGMAATAAYGGAGDDTITLTDQDVRRHPSQDYFCGGSGADQLTTDGGTATFIYNSVSDSTGVNYDTVTNFAPFSTDSFRLWFAVTAVDSAVTTGALSTATFDSDLAAAIGSSQLGADHAVLFTPDSGTLIGDHFLVIDANGTAGYQAGQDLVILLHSLSGTNFTTADFTT